MYGVCVLLFTEVSRKSQIVILGTHSVLQNVRPHDLFKGHAGRYTRTPIQDSGKTPSPFETIPLEDRIS